MGLGFFILVSPEKERSSMITHARHDILDFSRVFSVRDERGQTCWQERLLSLSLDKRPECDLPAKTHSQDLGDLQVECHRSID